MMRTPTAKFIARKHRAPAKATPLCGVVLAGGEGQRLRSFVKQLRGDDLPKQYVNFSGSHSMLEHTYIRAEKLISRERLFTIVNRAHLDFPRLMTNFAIVSRALWWSDRPTAKPAPDYLLPLTYLYKRYPEATVVVFPSDQFILEADHLIGHIRLAQAVVERRPSNLVLLGVTPDYEESEYGYILPTSARDTRGRRFRRVQTFIEKPDILRAHELIAQGALWNTMLMIFNAGVLLRWVSELHPDIL